MPSNELRGRSELLTDADWLAGDASDTLSEQAFLSAGRSRIRVVAIRTSSAASRVAGAEPVVVSVADPGEPAWLRSAGRALTELLALPENWNSYRARPVDPRAARHALEVLCTIMPEDGPLPAIVPTNRGGIQLEWHRAGVDLEVEVAASGDVCVSFEDPQAASEVDAEMSSDLGRLRDLLLQLTRRP